MNTMTNKKTLCFSDCTAVSIMCITYKYSNSKVSEKPIEMIIKEKKVKILLNEMG